MKNKFIKKAVAVSLCLLSAAAQAESRYSFTDLASLAPRAWGEWFGLNNAGAIVGKVDDQLSVYSNGTLKTFDLPYFAADDIMISDTGTIVYSRAIHNWESTETGDTYVFQNGVVRDVPALYPNVYHGTTYAYAINASGTVVGGSSHYKGNCQGDHCDDFRPWNRAISYQDGKTTDLGTLGGNTAYASDINKQGVIVGISDPSAGVDGNVFVYTDGTMRALGRNSSWGVQINDAAQIAGSAYVQVPGTGTGHYEAWLYDQGEITILGLADESNIVLDLNNAGQAIGRNASDSRFWLYSNGETIDLNTLLDEPNWKITRVIDLNDLGQILATATRPDGGLSYVLLTPDQPPVLLPAVPEPGTYAMLIGGLGVLAAWRRRRAA